MGYGIWYQPTVKRSQWKRATGWLKYQLWGRWHARLHIAIYEHLATERRKAG